MRAKRGEKALALDDNLAFAHSYILMGKPDQAIIEMHKESQASWRTFGLALAYYDAKRKAEADAALNEFIKKNQDGGCFQIAEIFAYRGDPDNAFQWLEKAYDLHDGGLAEIKGDPFLKKIEKDPRYSAFMKKMNLPG